MRGRFHQYLFTVLFALLTVLGLYSGQISTYTTFDIDFTPYTSSASPGNGNSSDFSLNNQEFKDQYSISRPPYHKLRANLSENENENDDTVETSALPELLVFFRESSLYFRSDLVSIFHNRQSAVFFANSEHLKLSTDDLYIQYRVIRL
ncbi:hypothetical protein CEY12_20285 [Chryseobacterium sp. T16E-39]|uniref:hypothetical protein n=1 Tax=Chryseobacterium sp. T16E-39 TaxID=2015076 RepID=UPI000B5B2FFB|nr:hypothetical protein [Chryseobacterium sp. T16E-39]ASK32278.1 hypothetical protein CEY12_20285 [Chryseobacterium sp. T16E-39]